MKNLTEVNGNRNGTNAKLKQKFAMLTNSDFLFVEEEEMLGRLQAQLSKIKDFQIIKSGITHLSI